MDVKGQGHVTGWKLDAFEREELLRCFPPEWPDIIADHVTLDAKAGPATALPRETSGEVVGGINDGKGLQAMVVRIGGTTGRPDGSTYHITWSLDRNQGRRPVESNDIIAKLGWRPLDNPVPITLIPARF